MLSHFLKVCFFLHLPQFYHFASDSTRLAFKKSTSFCFSAQQVSSSVLIQQYVFPLFRFLFMIHSQSKMPQTIFFFKLTLFPPRKGFKVHSSRCAQLNLTQQMSSPTNHQNYKLQGNHKELLALFYFYCIFSMHRPSILVQQADTLCGSTLNFKYENKYDKYSLPSRSLT